MGNETEISGRLLNTSFQTLKHMEHQVHGVLKLIQFDGFLVKSCRVSALKVGQITQKTHSLGKTTILLHYTCIPAVIRKMRNYKDLLCLVCIQ